MIYVHENVKTDNIRVLDFVNWEEWPSLRMQISQAGQPYICQAAPYLEQL
jgi:hypothetical protein